MKHPIHVALWTLFQIQPMSCKHIITQIFGEDYSIYEHLLRKLEGYCFQFKDANAYSGSTQQDFNVPGFLRFYIELTKEHRDRVIAWLEKDTQSAPNS